VSKARGRVSLYAAAGVLKVDLHNLRDRAAEGLIRVERVPSGRARLFVDLDELREDLRKLKCNAPGCRRQVRNAGRFCSMACAKRSYAPKVIRCRQCGKRFTAPGYIVHSTRRGRFCSWACSTAWRWAHEGAQGFGRPPSCVLR
jgi:hypothetical protein